MEGKREKRSLTATNDFRYTVKLNEPRCCTDVGYETCSNFNGESNGHHELCCVAKQQ